MEGYLHLLLTQIDRNRKINQLAKQERDAIVEGNIAMVMESIALRQEMITQLEALQAEMDPYVTDLPMKLGSMSARFKDQLVAGSEQLEEIIRETIEIEKENAHNLEKLKEEIGDRIKEISKGKQALSGYKSPYPKTPKLFNGRA